MLKTLMIIIIIYSCVKDSKISTLISRGGPCIGDFTWKDIRKISRNDQCNYTKSGIYFRFLGTKGPSIN